MSFKRKVKGMIKFILNNIPARKFDVRVVSLAPNELLKGRVALITGGTSGIGFHMAKAFLRSGAAVVITGRSEERLRLACGELNEDDHYKGRLFGLVMDNTRVDLFHDRFQKALDKVGSGGFPHIDILVNNAGVVFNKKIGMILRPETELMFRVNVIAVIEMVQLVSRLMARGHGGSIVNIASVTAVLGSPGQSAYSATKGAIIAFTKSAAKELASQGIRVNAVAPGIVKTERFSELYEESGEKIDNRIQRIALGRLGTPLDVANACAFLASDRSSYISGQILGVDGCASI